MAAFSIDQVLQPCCSAVWGFSALLFSSVGFCSPAVQQISRVGSRVTSDGLMSLEFMVINTFAAQNWAVGGFNI